jgi:hypothetical protein
LFLAVGYYVKKLAPGLIPFVLLVLAGCQQTLIKTNAGYQPESSDSYIVLNKSIVIPPNSARAFFQYGKLIPDARLNLYATDCELQINTVLEVPQTVQPGKFNIIRIIQDQSPIVILQPVMYAAIGVVWGYNSSPVDIKRFYTFRLESESQPLVRAVICRGVQDTPFMAELPTLEEMQAAVGEYIQFNLL